MIDMIQTSVLQINNAFQNIRKVAIINTAFSWTGVRLCSMTNFKYYLLT